MADNNKKNARPLDYTALLRELKQDGPGRLYLLWGPEDYLIRDFVGNLRKLCLAGGEEDFDSKRLEGATPDVRDVEEAINAMPFLGERTLVELRGFDVNQKKDDRLSAALGDIPEWCTVVITLPAGASPDGRLALVKQLRKTGRDIQFTAQGEAALYRWMQKRFAAQGKTVGREAMDRLMFLSGDLMNQLIPEIAKLCAYASGEEVTVSDVDTVAHHIPEATAFEMTNCIAERNFDGAADRLAELLAGDARPVEILGTVGWQIRRLYAARLAREEGKNAAFVKELLGMGSDYQVRRLMDSASRFSLEVLTRYVRLVAECAARSREQGAAVTEEEALKELLIRFAMESRHA